MLLTELCEDYISSNPDIQSLETARLLRLSAAHFNNFVGHEASATLLLDKNLAGFIQHRRRLGRAETTVERETAKLFTLARHAANLGLVPEPHFRVKKASVEAPIAFMRHEVRALFRATRRYTRNVGHVPGDIYFTAVLLVCWDTAERIGAILKIRKSDIDLRGRWVTIRVRKQRGAPITRRIRRDTARAIRRLLEHHDSEELFQVIGEKSLYYHLNQLLKAAGLPTDRRHKFHCLRRSHASWLYRAGGDATTSLDHASEDITRRFYLDPRVIFRRHAADLLFNPVGIWSRLLAAIGW